MVIVPDAKNKIPLWSLVLLVICLILVIAAVAGYFYTDLVFKKISQDIDAKNNALAYTDEETALEQSVRNKEEKIGIFERVVSAGKKPVNVFGVLEATAHPDVQYLEFEFDVEKGTVALTAKAKNFMVLGQQLLLLKSNENFKEINLSSVSMSEEGDVSFSLQLAVDPRLLK